MGSGPDIALLRGDRLALNNPLPASLDSGFGNRRNRRTDANCVSASADGAAHHWVDISGDAAANADWAGHRDLRHAR